jgi:predicted nuclease with TOPRIM domain
MAYLQFLTGTRAEEVVELNDAATLIVGSAADSHIQLLDPEIAPNHCQVYPAQGGFWLQDLGMGATILNMRRLAGETAGLREKDVFILGRTFIKYWVESPSTAAAAGGGGGGDSEALEAAQRENAALKEEVDRLRGWGSKGQELTDGLTEKLGEAKDHMTQLKARVGEMEAEVELTKGELASTQEELRAKEAERERLANELDATEGQLREVRGELARIYESSGSAENQLQQLHEELRRREEELNKTRKASETSRVDAKRLQVELGVAEQQLQAAKAATEGRLAEAEAALSESLIALAARRSALAALGVGRPATSLETVESPLGEVLETLALDADELDRLEAALLEHLDLECLRRLAGPPIAWGRPEEADQREVLLSGLRQRAERLDLTLSMDA